MDTQLQEAGEAFSQAVAAQVRAEIAAQGLTASEVARRIRTERTVLYRWLKAERPLTVTNLYRIAEAIGVGTVTLVERAEARFRDTWHPAPVIALPAPASGSVEWDAELRVASDDESQHEVDPDTV